MLGNRYKVKTDSQGTALDCSLEWQELHTEYWAIRRTYYPIRDRIVQYVKDEELNLLNQRYVNLSCWIDNFGADWDTFHYSIYAKLLDLQVKIFNMKKYQQSKMKGGE